MVSNNAVRRFDLCVIALIETVRPSEVQVKAMWDANPRGAGVAWRETGHDGVVRVRWEKGLTLEEITTRNKQLPLPYVMHFRIPSNGTTHALIGNHPFCIDENATSEFSGTAELNDTATGWVLFHNGFWCHNWKDKIMDWAVKGGKRIPSGSWSDSRGLAWIAYHWGLGMLEFANEKVVAFGPGAQDIEIFGDWDEVKINTPEGKEERILVSNKGWMHKLPNHEQRPGPTQHLLQQAKQSQTCGQHNQEGTPGGVSRQLTFPTTPGRVGDTQTAGRPEGGHQQERVQAAFEGAAQGHGKDCGGSSKTAAEERIADRIEASRCVICKKYTQSGTPHAAEWYCWQCWGDRMKKDGGAALCQWCKTTHTLQRVIFTGLPMCNACFETNGRPPMVFWQLLTEARTARANVSSTTFSGQLH